MGAYPIKLEGDLQAASVSFEDAMHDSGKHQSDESIKASRSTVIRRQARMQSAMPGPDFGVNQSVTDLCSPFSLAAIRCSILYCLLFCTCLSSSLGALLAVKALVFHAIVVYSLFIVTFAAICYQVTWIMAVDLESHREILKSLYLRDKKSLAEIMKHLAENYGVSAT